MTDFEPTANDERSVELSSIAAIYPEIVIDSSSPYKASLDIPVVLLAPLRIHFYQAATKHPAPAVLTPPTSLSEIDSDLVTAQNFKALAVGIDGDVIHLSHLPPLQLEIELPEGYPSEAPPIFNINTSPQWLPSHTLTTLIEDGTRLWEESGRDHIVYSYIDHLQCRAEAASDLIGENGEAYVCRDLKIALLDFNHAAERKRFEQETFECGICLEPKKGASCYRLLSCGHVFCVPCLQSFYNSCIMEGDVDLVKCLAPDCSKKKDTEIAKEGGKKKRIHALSPSELLQIPLEQETVQRYVFLKRKRRLEADKTTIYCPRKWCQGAARSKRHPKPTDPVMDEFDDSDEGDDRPTFDPDGDESQLPAMSDRVAICEDCCYAFCSVCKKGWHGELVRCFPRREAEISAEEKATEEYLEKYTSQCPTCSAPCQKRMGCNHMICFRCGSHFCYLCASWLEEGNPYHHFNTPGSDCYNRLWEMEGGDGIEPDGAEALHQLPVELAAIEDQGHGRQHNPNVNEVAGAVAVEDHAQARVIGQGPRQQPLDRRGLQRFLDLVNNDREDEWDSDELDDDF